MRRVGGGRASERARDRRYATGRLRDKIAHGAGAWLGPLALAGALAATGCGAGAQPAEEHAAGGDAAAADLVGDGAPAYGPRVAGSPGVPLRLAASGPVPDRFGVGRAASDAEIAAIDIDIMTDGAGLPPGRGTPAAGAAVYAGKCAACHGAAGEGVPRLGGRLIPEGDKHAFVDGADPDAFSGRTIGSYWPYATTLFDYVRRAMPFERPGSLTDEEVYAVVAWLLWQNEIVAEDAVIDATTLPQVEMPARDRFVADDRLSSDRVR